MAHQRTHPWVLKFGIAVKYSYSMSMCIWVLIWVNNIFEPYWYEGDFLPRCEGSCMLCKPENTIPSNTCNLLLKEKNNIFIMGIQMASKRRQTKQKDNTTLRLMEIIITMESMGIAILAQLIFVSRLETLFMQFGMNLSQFIKACSFY